MVKDIDFKTKQALQLTLKDVQLNKQTSDFFNTFLIWTALKCLKIKCIWNRSS